MTSKFLDEAVLEANCPEDLQAADPFPWWNPVGVLRAEAFERLCAEWPPLSLFERHEGIARAGGQRPHDRYYLAYESSIYHESGAKVSGGPGVASGEKLPLAWQELIAELEEDPPYVDFVTRFLGLPAGYVIRYAWHVGTSADEVSPHRDDPDKLGTHLMYFNPSDTWDASWGGATLMLGGKKGEALDPEFEDFSTILPADTIGNRSVLFRNTENAWHGVRALTAPDGAKRQLFNVIFERPSPEAASRPANQLQRIRSGLASRTRRLLRG